MVWREEEGGGVKEGRERAKKKNQKNKQKQNAALKRKKKNGSSDIETCGVNEMAKEDTEWERRKAQRTGKFADGTRSGGPVEMENDGMIMGRSCSRRVSRGQRPDKVSSAETRVWTEARLLPVSAQRGLLLRSSESSSTKCTSLSLLGRVAIEDKL